MVDNELGNIEGLSVETEFQSEIWISKADKMRIWRRNRVYGSTVFLILTVFIQLFTDYKFPHYW